MGPPASALRPTSTAANADDALIELEAFEAEWGGLYPACVQAWRSAWEHVIPFLSLPDELRRAVYTREEMLAEHHLVLSAVRRSDANGAEEALRHHLRMVLSAIPALREECPKFFADSES